MSACTVGGSGGSSSKGHSYKGHSYKVPASFLDAGGRERCLEPRERTVGDIICMPWAKPMNDIIEEMHEMSNGLLDGVAFSVINGIIATDLENIIKSNNVGQAITQQLSNLPARIATKKAAVDTLKSELSAIKDDNVQKFPKMMDKTRSGIYRPSNIDPHLARSIIRVMQIRLALQDEEKAHWELRVRRVFFAYSANENINTNAAKRQKRMDY